MPDFKTRFHNARIRLLRRSSVAPAAESKLPKAAAILPQLRPSASMGKLSSAITTRPTGDSASDSSHSNLDKQKPAVSLLLEHELRHPSAETVVDSQILLPPSAPGSLSSTDLHARHHDDSTPVSDLQLSSESNVTSETREITPVVTLQEPSPSVPTAMTPTHRKIWVKRPHASATLVQIKTDDLVDDVRDMILRKYANSLGRSFDSPDVTLRILPREHNQKSQDRTLGPEEEICRVLDATFPGGQTVEEALIIDVPHKRTPKPSPRVASHHGYYDQETARPLENGGEYFPPMPPVLIPSPAGGSTVSHESRSSHPERSMTVLGTGYLPPLPSPGGERKRTHSHRPKIGRHHTSSPTTMAANAISNSSIRPRGQRHDSSHSDAMQHAAPATAQPLPTPPAPVEPVKPAASTPPIPRVSSPRPGMKGRKRTKAGKDGVDGSHSLSSGLLDNAVPPINVLIVEDNMINLRVLGAFMERLKVRWQRAMNGREAVTKWRAGGFHLVLMDIQLPIMNGLEATKEIRRLERVNSIGVFSSASSVAPTMGPEGERGELVEADRLGDGGLFKSPVIIVALTASSLQSDRHEALAAGCNDFLTKPVNFLWLEQKIKEWGCMQALIDFDGWRKWKDFAAQSDSFKGKGKAGMGRDKKSSALKKLVEEGAESSSTTTTTGHETGHDKGDSSAS
ncbi:hypothetical protein EJ05DRAFT_475797 [Pseudovirgaria hyperparasitica]|uniref:Response regulatory domain-containing protein n=1 Tax=Pseudovirgaria hyperparasitica TaxID=470096 RepID=A0A6A6W6J4_9PEZI|nr:uncharacterized protein EJ05DRAFT_475797 [Pseudovirgaria hyperparasitica]KAF2758492.1 hypothetical protein EJ05DRAFT_475797 [Pseudovirgaria hyperparasitica]